ncbi:phage tail-like protein [Lewinella marina]|uniref:phage tail protein n=1 Tax=Neolewinella marina TaxID=438751 RepID=UPI001431B219|nr:phage tail protein [Neolewinella marina]NJB84324.1 phage tail-like protein [Neolewinella marina]
MPRLFFRMDWGSATDIPFQEVTGLDALGNAASTDDDLVFTLNGRPGARAGSSITLMRGVFPSGNDFRAWHEEIRAKPHARSPLRLTLLDEEGKPVMTWTLQNAWLTRIVSEDHVAQGEVVIERMEVAHEGITIDVMT